MNYETWLRDAADPSSVSWLLHPALGDTASQSDTFANAAFSLPTPPGSYQTRMPPRSHDSQSTYEGIFPETNSSAKASSVTTPLDHPPQDFERDHGDNLESSGSALRIGPEVNYPIRIQEGNPASHGRLSASVPMRGPYTPEDIPNPEETVLSDDLNFVTLHPGGLGSGHVCRVSFVYWVLHWCFVLDSSESLRPVRELWLQMIEGNDDGDDLWLWVDGDEEWIRQNIDTRRWVNYCPKLKEENWVAAQSALRCRIKRAQFSPRPVPKKTADLTLEDRARIQEATPAQRCAALYWLICTSRRKEELDLLQGWASRSNFALCGKIHQWFRSFGSAASFPEQPEAWNDFLEKRKAMGCDCFHDWTEETRDWARMMKWLRPEWNLHTDIGRFSPYDSCNACKSRAADIYDRLYGDDHSRDIPLLPIQLAFSLVVWHHLKEYIEFQETTVPFLKAVASKSLSPNAQREADRRFWPLYSPGERNTNYSPWVNAYPKFMRGDLVHRSSEVAPYSQLHSLHPAEALQDQYLDELPVGFADDAPNLITLVGAVIWILACRFLDGPKDWHVFWAEFTYFEDILPLPEFAGTQLELGNHLKRLCSEGSPCFRYADYLSEDRRDDLRTIYAAIVVYVKSLNLGPKFKGCSICHAFYVTATVELGVSAETSRTSRPGEPVPTENTLPSPLYTQGSSVIRHHQQEASSALASRPLQSQNLVSAKSADAEMDFGVFLRDTSLAPAERQQTFDVRIKKLVALASSIGLRLPGDLLAPAVPPERRLTFPALASMDFVDIGANQEQQISAPSTQPGDVTTLIFNSAPNGDLKKRHKIARIKEILIDMLRKSILRCILRRLLILMPSVCVAGAIDFPLHNRYLPWSTLEGDLQKHGFEITNWPSGVPRENDKGINTLSAGHVHKLYLALTQARVEDRPRFARHVDQSTDQDQGMTHVPNLPGSKRRLEITHNDGKGKRTRFKVTTAEHYAGQSTGG
ncbi:hypothetical protein BDN67DRAFT_975802 [Paxillus ammoniavirescens]|nr:hypothetical protein BDN67DRAFT_975802 [Paxillus ammoniavirescens]